MDILEFTKNKLDELALNIDEETGMLHGYTVPNYHSNLKPGVYHTFTQNTNFALSVFASEYEKFYPTANEILRKPLPVSAEPVNVPACGPISTKKAWKKWWHRTGIWQNSMPIPWQPF